MAATARLATSTLRSIVFPMIDDPVGGILRPGEDYAIFGLQRLALLGNTPTRSTASRFRVAGGFRGLRLLGGAPIAAT